MPLPLFVLPALSAVAKGAAILAGVVGVGTAVNGAAKMIDANDTAKAAQSRHERNMERFKKENQETEQEMDTLGKLELEILHSFGEFSNLFEQIKNRPVFATYTQNGVTLPRYDGEKLKEVSVGADVLLSGISSIGLGAAGGFAAAGATTAAVMALGTASTGTAIASLSGAAATNATLALLGGGTLAAGGGGMAAGAALLGAATWGVGLLVGGIIFNFAGGKVSDQADEAWAQAKRAEKTINEICSYLADLRSTAKAYYATLSKVNELYRQHLNELRNIVSVQGHTDWNHFTYEEQIVTENTVLLVGLLYNMCKVELVLKAENDNDINRINKNDIEKSVDNANKVLADQFGID